VIGTFRDVESAERAYNSLAGRGYSEEDVNLLMPDETRKKYFDDEAKSGLGSKAMEGAGAGGAIGGTIGAVLGALAAVETSLAIPGLGIVIAGPIVAALAGAGAAAHRSARRGGHSRRPGETQRRRYQERRNRDGRQSSERRGCAG
jgi:hypothetical protein